MRIIGKMSGDLEEKRVKIFVVGYLNIRKFRRREMVIIGY